MIQVVVPLIATNGREGAILNPAAPVHGEQTLDHLRTALLEYGPANESVVLLHTDGPILTLLDEATRTQAKSAGWEVLIMPASDPSRRSPRLPANITTHFGMSEDDAKALAAHHPSTPSYLSHPRLDRAGCIVAMSEGEYVGWIPVLRLSNSAVSAKSVFLAPGFLDDEPTRRTIVRLGLFAKVRDHFNAQGMAVFSWIPDDGDPVNDIKAQVTASSRVTHWFMRTVSRDLRQQEHIDRRGMT